MISVYDRVTGRILYLLMGRQPEDMISAYGRITEEYDISVGLNNRKVWFLLLFGLNDTIIAHERKIIRRTAYGYIRT